MKRLQQQTLKFDKTTKTLTSTACKSSSSDQGQKQTGLASSTKKAFKSSPFLSLEQSMNDRTLQVYKDDTFVVIRDKYPKAKCHMLLIPLLINGVKLIKLEDLIRLPNSIQFLKQMKRLVSDKILALLPASIHKSHLMLGFHAIQSMQPLHMHIITKDFNSDCFKHKKHWNSFNTAYFVNLDALIQHLEEDLDTLKTDYFKEDKFNLRKINILNDYLKVDLKCNFCGITQSNIPNLKKHLLTHSNWLV